jgi:NADH:ubiquinone oxidoreductase subunit 3 (subunit A)
MRTRDRRGNLGAVQGPVLPYRPSILVFDIETVFLYPWAIAFDKLGLFAVLEGVLFILILAAGLLYAWKKGAFEWS